MRVKILEKSPSAVCKCESHLEHWQKYSGLKPFLCYEKFCTSKAEYGAGVRKLNSPENEIFSIPVCPEHHEMVGQEIEISDYSKLAPLKEQYCEITNDKGEGK